MKSVLVVGASTPLGRSVAAQLSDDEAVDRLLAVEPRPGPASIEGVELVAFDADHREAVAILRDYDIDTVVHCGLAADRSGRPGGQGADVITTMRLGAAVGHADVPVRSWVVVSSTAVYPCRSHMPLLHMETGETDTGEETPGAALLEAEEYARDVAERTPHLNVALLRLAPLAGTQLGSDLSALLELPILPAIPGFDPAIQLLHEEDALDAIAWAAEREIAGVYNVASRGVVRWSEAALIAGRSQLPVLPVEAGLLAPIARGLGLPHVPDGMRDLLLYGHAVDTAKLESAGFVPAHDQRSCLEALG